ncbi:MAG: mercuric transporter MerT family protein [Gammaproteobacteria bacterium]|nr:mercuric transporter MerT family protein [Gammaproteobacteria bacterium]
MSKNDSNLSLFAGIAAAIGAGLCCVGPFLLLTLGIGGAWIGNLTLLEPYRPLFIVAVLALFSRAGWKLYRPVGSCESGTACAIPQIRKRRQVIFWITALLAMVLVTSTYWIPLIA